MMSLTPFIAAALLVPGQADSPFTWKLKKGDVFYAKASNSIDQTVEVLGNKQAQKQEQTTYHKYAVKSADKDGIVLEQTVLKTEMEGSLPGAGDVAKRMKGLTLTFTLNSKFEVTKVGGYDKFLETLVGDDAAAKKAVGSMLSEDLLKQGVTEMFGVGPNKAVKVGDTWKRDSKLSMGPIGVFQVEAETKFASSAASGDKATWKAKATFSAPKDAGDGPFSVVKGELKSDKFEGDFVFDSKLGRIVTSTTRAHFAGKLTISVMGNEVEMDLDQNLIQTTTISAKNLLDE